MGAPVSFELEVTDSVRLDIASLRSLTSFGYGGGRDAFREFCRSIFTEESPRFLRTDDDRLVVFRHADLRRMAAIPELGNVPSGVLAARARGDAPAGGADSFVGAAMVEVFANQFFFTNAPIHAPLRRMTLAQIGPKRINELGSVARDCVRRILAETPIETRIDFVRDVAVRLTVYFWGARLGLTEAELQALVPVVRAMSPAFSARLDLAELRLADQAFSAYRRLVEGAALRSLAAGGHPFVEDLAAELAGIDLADDPYGAGIVPANVGVMLAGVLAEGFHTTAVAATNAVWVLARQPGVLQDVSDDPSLLPAAIAEAWRLEPPALMFNSYAIDDIDYKGWLIPKGTGVLMMWGAGNHDPGAFPDPDRFDLSRGGRGLTTFGGGAQICPGRHVAGLLTRVLIEEIAAAGLVVEPIDDTDAWIDGHILSELRVFPVRLARRGDATQT
jgi:cytochrome P450